MQIKNVLYSKLPVCEALYQSMIRLPYATILRITDLNPTDGKPGAEHYLSGRDSKKGFCEITAPIATKIFCILPFKKQERGRLYDTSLVFNTLYQESSL